MRTWRCNYRPKKDPKNPTVVKMCTAGVEEDGSQGHRRFKLISPHTTCIPDPFVYDRDAIIQAAKEEGLKQLRLGGRAVAEKVANEAFKSGKREAIPHLDKLGRITNYNRVTERPENPSHILFDIDESDFPVGFYKGPVKVGSERHLIFATDKQLELLRSAVRWYVDGTFKIVDHPFKQLFSIHVFMRKGSDVVQVPVCFVFMSRRTALDYKSVFKEIKKIAGRCNVVEFVSDFEKAIWQGIKSVFPAHRVMGCAFHWTQAVFRRLKKLGLGSLYARNVAVKTLCRKLMSLHLLPKNDIPKCFYSLQRQAENLNIPLLSTFFTYAENTWISNTAFYRPAKWSVYRQPIRTNNHAEGWHHRIILVGRACMNFYDLVKLLHVEAELISMFKYLLCVKKLKRSLNTKYHALRAELFSVWDRFRKDDSSGSFTTVC